MKYMCDSCKEYETCQPEEKEEVCGYYVSNEKSSYQVWQEQLPSLRKTFENHRIEAIHEYDKKNGEYLFREPGKWAYSIHIILRPGTIIIYGDIRPAVILSQSGIDLAWLKGSVNDPNYLLEKDITKPCRHGEGARNAWYLVAGLQMFCEALAENKRCGATKEGQ